MKTLIWSPAVWSRKWERERQSLSVYWISWSWLCRSSDGEVTVRTPFVLYHTKYLFSLPLWNWKRNFILELTPVVDDGNTHESQPVTYHINKMNKGSLPLAAAPRRLESLLDMMSVFQTQKPNGTGRDFICSPTGTHQCCDYIGVYTMDLFHDGGSCKRMSRWVKLYTRLVTFMQFASRVNKS